MLGGPVKAVHIDEGLRDWLGNVVEHHLRQRHKTVDAEKGRLKARASRIRSLMDKAYANKLEGKIPEDYWAIKSREWRKELSRVN